MRLRSLALFRYWHARRKNFSAQRQLHATHQSFISHLALTVLRDFQLHNVRATHGLPPWPTLVRFLRAHLGTEVGLGRNVHPSWSNNSLLGPLLGGFNYKRTAPSFVHRTRAFLMPRLLRPLPIQDGPLYHMPRLLPNHWQDGLFTSCLNRDGPFCQPVPACRSLHTTCRA